MADSAINDLPCPAGSNRPHWDFLEITNLYRGFRHTIHTHKMKERTLGVAVNEREKKEKKHSLIPINLYVLSVTAVSTVVK